MKKKMIIVVALVAIVFLVYAPCKSVEAAENDIHIDIEEGRYSDEFKAGEGIYPNCIEDGCIIRKGAIFWDCYEISDCEIWVGDDYITTISPYNTEWKVDRDYRVKEVAYDYDGRRTSIFATLEPLD